MPAPPSFRLLLVTDRHVCCSRQRRLKSRGQSFSDPEEADRPAALVEIVRVAVSAAPPGSVAVMLREKDLPGRHLLKLALDLREVTREAGALLLVNDRADVASASGACGTHLPSAGIPPEAARGLLGEQAVIGVSTHSLSEVHRAAESGASYVTLGPVFDTPSKRRFGSPLGLSAISEAARALDQAGSALPVLALGGITTPVMAGRAMEAGASGVAFIRAVLAADDPAAAMASFVRAVGLS